MLSIILLLMQLVAADIAVVGPSLDQSFDASGGTAKIPIQWLFTPNTPSQDDFTSLTFSLCSGPNYKIEAFKVIGKLSDIGTTDFETEVSQSVGANGYYYVQIYAATTDGYTIHYSPRFKLTGMTGSKLPDTLLITAPPTPETRVTTGDLGATIDSKSFDIPYGEQNGKAKFAPMQTQPGTKITATTWSRRYATSAVSFFTSLTATPVQHTTLTPGWSYYISSDYNYAPPAPFPSDNGGWYDPKKRQSFTTRKLNMDKLRKRRQTS